ncbi:hypothetical protein [Thiogranum longum]
MKKVTAFWLALTLVVLPLQGLAAQLGALNNQGCPMAHAGADAAPATPEGHSALHAVEAALSHGCSSCDDQGCTGGECAANGCSLLHVPAAAVSGFVVNAFSESESIVSTPFPGVVSRNDPPLLRPPV